MKKQISGVFHRMVHFLVVFPLWLILAVGNFTLAAWFALEALDTGEVLPSAFRCFFHLGVYVFLCGSKPNERGEPHGK